MRANAGAGGRPGRRSSKWDGHRPRECWAGSCGGICGQRPKHCCVVGAYNQEMIWKWQHCLTDGPDGRRHLCIQGGTICVPSCFVLSIIDGIAQELSGRAPTTMLAPLPVLPRPIVAFEQAGYCSRCCLWPLLVMRPTGIAVDCPIWLPSPGKGCLSAPARLSGGALAHWSVVQVSRETQGG